MTSKRKYNTKTLIRLKGPRRPRGIIKYVRVWHTNWNCSKVWTILFMEPLYKLHNHFGFMSQNKLYIIDQKWFEAVNESMFSRFLQAKCGRGLAWIPPLQSKT